MLQRPPSLLAGEQRRRQSLVSKSMLSQPMGSPQFRGPSAQTSEATPSQVSVLSILTVCPVIPRPVFDESTVWNVVTVRVPSYSQTSVWWEHSLKCGYHPIMFYFLTFVSPVKFIKKKFFFSQNAHCCLNNAHTPVFTGKSLRREDVSLRPDIVKPYFLKVNTEKQKIQNTSAWFLALVWLDFK